LGGFWSKTTMTVFKKNRLTPLGAWLESHATMKKPLPLLAALCLGGILASGTANAASYYYTTNTSQTVTNTVFSSWQNFVFDKFNVADGVKGGYMDLLNVTVSVDYSYLVGQLVISNLSSNQNLTVDEYTSSFSVRTNSLGYTAFTSVIDPVKTSPDWSSVSINPSATTNFVLDSGQYFVSSTNSQSINSSLFSSYTGVGTVAFSLRNLHLIATSGGGYTVQPETVGALTSMTVTYTYGVPEPSTYLLFGLGGLALVVAYRRKRAA
jgi:hypothetical protein